MKEPKPSSSAEFLPDRISRAGSEAEPGIINLQLAGGVRISQELAGEGVLEEVPTDDVAEIMLVEKLFFLPSIPTLASLSSSVSEPLLVVGAVIEHEPEWSEEVEAEDSSREEVKNVFEDQLDWECDRLRKNIWNEGGACPLAMSPVAVLLIMERSVSLASEIPELSPPEAKETIEIAGGGRWHGGMTPGSSSALDELPWEKGRGADPGGLAKMDCTGSTERGLFPTPQLLGPFLWTASSWPFACSAPGAAEISTTRAFPAAVPLDSEALLKDQRRGLLLFFMFSYKTKSYAN